MSLDALLSEALDRLRLVIREELAKQARPAEYLTPEEAATVARVDKSTVHAWLRDRRLRRYGEGRIVRIRRDELDRLLAGPAADEADDLAAKVRQFRGAG